MKRALRFFPALINKSAKFGISRQYYFSYNCFRTVLFVRYFSYNYFSYELFVQVLFVQIQKGGGKITRQGGEKSSPKEQFMRGYTAPYARTFAPSPVYLYEKYLYEKYRTKTIVRKVILPKKRFPDSEKSCILMGCF